MLKKEQQTHAQTPQSDGHTTKQTRPDFAYSVGEFVLGSWLAFWRKLKQTARRLLAFGKKLLAFCLRPLLRFVTFCKALLHEFTDPFSKAAEETAKVYEAMRLCGKQERSAYCKKQAKPLAKAYGRAAASLLNHLLPLAACIALIFVLGRSFNQNYLLEVTYDGKLLGYVDSELTYQEAQNMVLERTVFDQSEMLTEQPDAQKPAVGPGGPNASQISTSGGVRHSTLPLLPMSESEEKAAVSQTEQEKQTEQQKSEAAKKTVFRLVPVNHMEQDDSESLCDKLIAAMGDQIEDATGLYVDDTLYGAVKDGALLNTALQNMLDKADDGSGSVSFYRDVKLREGLYPTNVILDMDTMTQLLSSTVSGKREYTIQKGDAPYSIAQKFDLKYSDFLAMNPNIEKTCFVGQTVTIAKQESFLPILITKQITYKRPVSYQTKTVKSSNYYNNYAKVTQAGKQGEDTITANVSYLDGVEVDREIVKTVRTKKPVDQVVLRGTKVNPYVNGNHWTGPSSNSSSHNKGGFIWPTTGTITCRWWGYYMHLGLDIANRTGTPIWAAADGTVIYSGWKNGGFGNYVLIDHGNGMRTGYMHNSYLLVRAGQQVKQGQQIARMGSTGNSSGSHCHFEVWDHGVLRNPELYLP